MDIYQDGLNPSQAGLLKDSDEYNVSTPENKRPPGIGSTYTGFEIDVRVFYSVGCNKWHARLKDASSQMPLDLYQCEATNEMIWDKRPRVARCLGLLQNQNHPF